MNDDISIVLRVKNEENHVGYCIQSILNIFKFPEIIIIDNNSTDETISVVKHFEKDLSLNSQDRRYTDIKIFNIDEYTPGKALNFGVKNSSNKNIMIVSAHCKIINFNFKENVELLNSYEAIFGKQIPIWNGKKITKRYVWSNFHDTEKINYFSEQENRYFFHNAFSFFKKETLLSYPFNEKITNKEDRYWAQKVIKNNNLNILYYPKNFVEHYYTKNGATWKNI